MFFLHYAEEYSYFNNEVREAFFWLVLLKLFLVIVAALSLFTSVIQIIT